MLTSINRTQFNALKTKPGVRSLYANRTFRLLDLEGRTITGVENLIRDSQVTALNNGLPVTGKNIGVSYIDTGIDATHPDLKDRTSPRTSITRPLICRSSRLPDFFPSYPSRTCR